MEKIAELRTICQTTAKKDVSNVYMRYVSRFFSIYVTRLLLPFPITADQVSFAMIVTGVASGFLFMSPEPGAFLKGALCLQLWYILDCVDGEVARYRFYKNMNEVAKDKMQLSMTGAYWDYLNHYIVHGFVPLGISYGLFMQNGETVWLLLGFLASLAQTMLLAVHDTKSRAFVTMIEKETKGSRSVRAKASEGGAATPKKKHGPLKWAFIVMHYSCTYPTVMNVITLAALFEARAVLVAYYAVASALVFLGLAAKNLFRKGLDREFEGRFEIGETAR